MARAELHGHSIAHPENTGKARTSNLNSESYLPCAVSESDASIHYMVAHNSFFQSQV